MKNNILIIGADAQNLRIILNRGSSAIEEVFTDDAKNRNELAIINNFLKSENIDPQQLLKIGVIIHPNNNTSVRVVQTIAKTFSWFLGIPLLEINTENLLSLSKQELLNRF